MASSKMNDAYLSLKTFKKRHHVSYICKDRNGVLKVQKNQATVKFVPQKSELHYLDLNNN